MGVGSCGQPISVSAIFSPSPFCTLVKRAPISALADDAITFFIGPLIGTGCVGGFRGSSDGSDRRKWPPAQLLVPVMDMKE
eukprot:11669512-Ditylum_brightwellii.AAC.1